MLFLFEQSLRRGGKWCKYRPSNVQSRMPKKGKMFDRPRSMITKFVSSKNDECFLPTEQEG